MKGFGQYDSPLGPIAISSDDGFITAIEFGKKDHKEMQDETVQACMEQLEDYFSGQLRAFDLPIRPQGTEFQKKVWKILLAIEYGTVHTYMEISKKTGDTKAVRAVGTANGQNPIAIVIPCHRVIGSDGSLTGYAGGLDRKEWLLRHERAPIFAQQELF